MMNEVVTLAVTPYFFPCIRNLPYETVTFDSPRRKRFENPLQYYAATLRAYGLPQNKL
jgi:hypothetical protein